MRSILYVPMLRPADAAPVTMHLANKLMAQVALRDHAGGHGAALTRAAPMACLDVFVTHLGGLLAMPRARSRGDKDGVSCARVGLSSTLFGAGKLIQLDQKVVTQNAGFLTP